jgi:exodeoxyribonuclease-5
MKKAVFWWGVEKEFKKYFRIFGYAGTGKTFMVNEIIKELKLSPDDVVFVAYTGAAVLNLKKRGNKDAKTIHKLIYHTEVYEKPIYGKNKDGSINEKEILGWKKYTKTTKRNVLEKEYKLIVVDEFSMVSDEVSNDLLSFGVPIIMLGDDGQLPPVQGVNSYMKEYDALLDEIVRQDGSSPIVDLSFKIRNREALPYGSYGNNSEVGIFNYERLKEDKELLPLVTQVICCTNKTRKKLNKMMRELIGITTDLPTKGDKLLCTMNNWQTISYSPKLDDYVSLVNGGIYYVDEIERVDFSMDIIYLKVHPDFDKDCIFSGVPVDIRIFQPKKYPKPETLKDLPPLDGNRVNKFDFGYAITTHKSQGNQYKRVVFIGEGIFWNFEPETQIALTYTAITRAEKNLCMYMPRNYFLNNHVTKDEDFWKSWSKFYV